MAVVWQFQDPYAGNSGLTSNTVDLRDCFDWTLSFATIGQSFSTTTLQFSNSSGDGFNPLTTGAIWSSWTVLGNVALVSGVTLLDPPLGYRFARFIRSTSSATIELNKQIRT